MAHRFVAQMIGDWHIQAAGEIYTDKKKNEKQTQTKR